MSNENLIFLGLGRLRDQAVLATCFDKISRAQQSEVESAFTSYLLETGNSFASGARDKRHLSEGCLFLLSDKDMCCVYALASRNPDYPERHAFACLAEFIRMVGETDSARELSMVEKGSLTRTLRGDLKTLLDRYDKPRTFDKSHEVREKVDHVKDIMQENVKRILESHANVESLEQKADGLRVNAQTFQRSAVDLRRMMWWRDFKMKLIMVAVVLAVILYITVPLIVHFSKKKK
eukprot:GDKI01011280.1.p1 GENE.GDKI01011280.1~~GDKI01011280.1.p1  ORF type:complete len:235 (-),score=49.91 GDKI01011280.1:28-732(-)